MYSQLFHIFRNTPLGRETMLQSLYFCRQIGANPAVYIPQHTKFLMYFDNDVVQVDLEAHNCIHVMNRVHSVAYCSSSCLSLSAFT